MKFQTSCTSIPCNISLLTFCGFINDYMFLKKTLKLQHIKIQYSKKFIDNRNNLTKTFLIVVFLVYNILLP